MGRGAPCLPLGGSGLGRDVSVVIPGVGYVETPPLAGSALLGNSAPRQDPAIGNDPERTTPNFNILGLTPANNVVRDIYVEETVGYELPLARITLNNPDKLLDSTILAKEQTVFKVAFGWTNPGIQSHGTFIVQRPKFKYMARENPLVVEIVAYGEGVRLGATERREVYKKQRDSDIARKIASRYGFTPNVETTDPVHEQVIQANESDYKFLAKRAKLYGYFLFVEDGVLHFHRPRPVESGIRLTYLEEGQQNLSYFAVHSRTFMRGLSLRLTQLDPLTKDQIEERSGEGKDPIQNHFEFNNWKDLVTIPGVGQPEKFITNEGHEQTKPLLKTQIDRMAQSTRYVIAGTGSAIGLETLRANQFIRIDGIGRSAGRYYVTKATHQLSAESGHKVQFEVIRAGAGDSSGLDPGTQELTKTTPQSAGTVAL
jgi:phage protein D